jgi:predicted transcriptional regulator
MLSPELIKNLRLQSGLSIADAAKQVEVERRTWQRYESGEREIPAGVVKLFCLINGLAYPPK